jgi:hypothetical protein
MTVERDEFEAWWIADGYSLTQDKNSAVDFAELVWLAARQTHRENLLEIGVDRTGVGARISHTGTQNN